MSETREILRGTWQDLGQKEVSKTGWSCPGLVCVGHAQALLLQSQVGK